MAFSGMPWSFTEATPMVLVDRASLPEMQAGYPFCVWHVMIVMVPVESS